MCADVCKVIAYYEGECARIRCTKPRHPLGLNFAEPGPATKGIPFLRLVRAYGSRSP